MERRRDGKRFGVKKLIVILLIIAAIVGGFFAFKAFKSKKQATATVAEAATDMVMRGDVSLTITGSATVEPYERYEILAKVSGDVIECNYEEGDIVEKDAVLYRFDTASTDISMQKQRISLEQSENNYQKALKEYDKLNVTADASGVISGLDVKVGDEIKNGTRLAEINDTRNLKVTLPFNSSQAARINVGDTAYVSSSVHMSNVEGVVTHKDASSHAGSDGSQMYNVTISFKNPGAFSQGITLGGAVGDMISAGSGQVELSDSGTATSETSGEVTALLYKNGDYVEKGTVIAKLKSDDIADSVRNSKNSYENAKLSMQDAEEKLQDYILTTPISGTIITKNVKAGDTVDKTNSSKTMMVIADVSKLKFSLEIDELDVSKVTAGQKVEITCDALPDERFEGEITRMSVEGTSTNGVTTYTADVVINNPGNLRPSMNIDASVVAQQSLNTLYVPSEDVKAIGNMHYVFKKSDAEKKDNGMPSKGGKDMPDFNKNNAQKGQMPEGATPPGADAGKERPTGGNGEKMPQGMPRGENNTGAPGGMNAQGGGGRRLPPAPEGFETVVVNVGVIGDEFTEILSGLSEGDEVYAQTSSGSNMMGGMRMGGMPGGMRMPGGGGMRMPAGGGMRR